MIFGGKYIILFLHANLQSRPIYILDEKLDSPEADNLYL